MTEAEQAAAWNHEKEVLTTILAAQLGADADPSVVTQAATGVLLLVSLPDEALARSSRMVDDELQRRGEQRRRAPSTMPPEEPLLPSTPELDAVSVAADSLPHELPSIPVPVLQQHYREGRLAVAEMFLGSREAAERWVRETPPPQYILTLPSGIDDAEIEAFIAQFREVVQSTKLQIGPMVVAEPLALPDPELERIRNHVAEAVAADDWMDPGWLREALTLLNEVLRQRGGVPVVEPGENG